MCVIGGSVFVNEWSNAFSAIPRVTPFMKSNDAIISGLEKALATVTMDTFKSVYPLAGNVTFYTNTRAEMRAYSSKPASFDVVLALCVATYCAALFVVMAV